MSIVQNPLIGRAKQKLGGTVFTTWKGINVIKGRPLSVANPRSDAQLMRRAALVRIVGIGRKLAGVINLGFREQAVRKSEFNAFVGTNLRNAFNYSAPPVAGLRLSNMVVSQGTITPQAITSILASAADAQVELSWTAATLAPGQSATDTLSVAMYNEDLDEWYSTATNVARSANNAIVPTPTAFLQVDFPVRVWAFFSNARTRKASDSTQAMVAVPS